MYDSVYETLRNEPKKKVDTTSSINPFVSGDSSAIEFDDPYNPVTPNSVETKSASCSDGGGGGGGGGGFLDGVLGSLLNDDAFRNWRNAMESISFGWARNPFPRHQLATQPGSMNGSSNIDGNFHSPVQ